MRLQDLKVVYICPDHNDKYRARKEHMESLLSRIGFPSKRIEHFKSSTQAYPDCLSQATIDILKAHMDCPVLILKDDVEFTGVDTFDLVEGADAIYFGLSTSAGHPINNIHHGPAQYSCYSKTQVRIWNMLGGHAILFISSAYKKLVIDAIQAHMGQKYNTDILMLRLHASHLILANRKPSFYQAAAFNRTDHEERHTKIEFNDKPLRTTVVTAFYPLKSKHGIEKYIEWINHFCNIQCSLVVFTDEQTALVFQTLRKGLPTRIIVKPFESYEMTSPAMMELWTKHHTMDREQAIHTPALYAVWAMKQECVALAIQANPFGTDWFIWCDAGIHRDVSKHTYYAEFPQQADTLCRSGTIGFLEVNRIPDSFVTDPSGPAPSVSLGGGVIIGDKAAWATFCPAYKAMLQRMDARGEFIGKDQTVFFRMLTERVMPFQLFQPQNVPVDPWMQLPCILAGTIPMALDERFTTVSYVKLIGGLGNQLFQIAAAYAHARRSGGRLQLSNDVDFGNGRPSYFTTFLHQCKASIGPAPPAPTYREPHFHYTAIPADAQAIYGYYQSSRYFADVSGDIRRLFDPHPVIKNVATAKYGSYLTEEGKATTVIVHVRRGDYMTASNTRIHGILTPLYYRAAMKHYLDTLGPSTQVLLFSDDIEYCRATYGGDPGVTCIDEQNESVALHFMSQFRYYIMCNSTFSWWATYLGEPAVTVVAPDPWFGPAGPQDWEDIYEPGWLRLKAE